MTQKTRVKPGKHTLPYLQYAYDALEPHIDEQTMRLHHDKHHAGYVKGLNNAEEMLAEARNRGDFALIKHWSREAAFHGSGHFLHSVFWKNMSPEGGGDPEGNSLTPSGRSSGASRISGSISSPRPQKSRALDGAHWYTTP